MKLSVPYVRQSNNMVCGPAVVQMMLSYYKKPYPSQDTLTRTLKIDLQGDIGTTHGELISFLRSRGLIVSVTNNASFTDITNGLSAKRPVIVHYTEPSENDDHYAIITELTNTHVIFNDPWNGKGFSMPRKEFYKRWSDLKGKKFPRWMLTARPR